MGTWDNIKEFALDKIFPRKCPLCGGLLRANERICGKCSDSVIFIQPPICQRCGRPIYDCACRGENFIFARCISPFAYTKAVRNGIHRLKFHNSPECADFFALFMATAVRREYGNIDFDLVLSIPMHASDIHKRGYNQADLLAKNIADRIGVPFGKRILVKPIRNNTQHTLTRGDRRGNVAGVFKVAQPYLVAGKRILLCDDIITTGSTLDACAEELMNAGAAAVYCVTAAAVVGSEERSLKRAYL